MVVFGTLLILYFLFIGGLYFMAGIAELRAGLDRLEAAVARIVPPAPPVPLDLQPELDRVNAMSDKVEAAFPPVS